ncbi:two-partner secretion domain-containing protein, partial [Phormidium sp. CCY1219]|uniref:two-partner secretion domain-containing protein n=1 Tax=Phormidium sp. CCY1219 TaxID=2886104 RepID=UPI002D1EFA7B
MKLLFSEKKITGFHRWWLFPLWIAPLLFAERTQAQPIVPAADGTDTVVTPAGEVFHIQGGQTSGDRANLFHSFEQFELHKGQTANFISNPNIENILGRVTGGNASLINGLIQVSGGNSNLFLVNPAGIVFGADARLNVPGSFNASTATGIGFDRGGWLHAEGMNEYATLVGTPSLFSFSLSSAGNIINAGDLEVGAGENLTLLGGRVINTGKLRAPGGNITVAAVRGEGMVRVAQAGHLLSLEISPFPSRGDSATVLTPLSLPALLTGRDIGHARGLTVNGAGDVVLTGSGLQVENGDLVVANGSIGGDRAAPGDLPRHISLSAAENLTIVQSDLASQGDLSLLAGDTVRVRDRGTPLRVFSGGNLRIQGNRHIDILALSLGEPTPRRPHATAASPFQAAGDITLVSNGILSADSHFSAGGNFSIFNVAGEAGTFVSLYDPIVRSDGDVIFGDYTGVSLKVEAGGAIAAGEITITGPDTTLSDSADPEADILTSSAALILRSGISNSEFGATVPAEVTGGTFFSTSNSPSNNNISVGKISTASGPVIIDSANLLVVDSIATDGGAIALSAIGDIVATGTLDSAGGNIDITTENFVRVQGTFSTPDGVSASISSADSNGLGGSIRIEHGGSTTTPFVVGDSTTNGTAGAITSGSETIAPQFSVPVPPSTYTQGNIDIVTTAPDPPEQPSEETPEQPSEEQPSQETPEQPSEETPEQPSQETPEQPSEEQPTGETPEQPSEEQPTGETPEQPTGETPEQPTGEQPTGETPEQPTGETPEQPTGETP